MIDIVCTLIKVAISKDNIGNDIETTTETTVPIIKNEDVYSSEFYNASQVGIKPNLRLRISALNYDNQTRLRYLNQEYEIIRIDTPTIDEISLVCERKVGNGS